MESEDQFLFDLFNSLSQDERVATTFDRLAHPKHRGEIEHLAASHVVVMTQATRLRTALEFIVNEKRIGGRKNIRKFAADALEYADEFTLEDVIASHKRVMKPGEH